MVISQKIETWLIQIGQVIKQRLSEGIEVSLKTSLADVVTNVDKEVEQLFRQYISEQFPTHVVLGEENSSCDDISQSDDVWVIDPIDGTLNFVKEQQNFVVMVSYFHKGVGQYGFIYDVMLNELYTAIKGRGAYKNGELLPKVCDLPISQSILTVSANLFLQEKIDITPSCQESLSLRMIGSSGKSMLGVITGKYNGYVSLKVHAWDYMAGLVFADELGIAYSTIDNKPLPLFDKTTMIFATPKVHEHISNHSKCAD